MSRANRLKEEATRFSAAVVARETVCDVVRNVPDVEFMPLKGVLLQAIAYADPAERELKDVDVAVRSSDFERAYDALLRAGYSTVREEPGLYEVSVRSDRLPLCVDLHRAFSSARRFHLNPDVMFSRGRRDSSLFGCPVVLPDDYDVFAHLLAHAALDFAGGQGWHRPEDLQVVATARRLVADQCARRLDEVGLGRWARIVLASEAPAGRTEFGKAVLSQLLPDHLGDAIAAGARSAFDRGSTPNLLARTAAVLLNPTLWEAVLALAEAVEVRLPGPRAHRQAAPRR